MDHRIVVVTGATGAVHGEGRFFGARKQLAPPGSTADVADQERLFTESEKLIAG